MTIEIEQPFNDERIKVGKYWIGCVTKENADFIMSMRQEIVILRKENEHLRNKIEFLEDDIESLCMQLAETTGNEH